MSQDKEILPDVYGLSLADMERLMTAWGQPAYRARQIFRQLYVNLVDSPLAMTDLPLALRERLVAETRPGSLTPAQVHVADQGLTRKALFRLPVGVAIESVLMIYPDRATVCVSTQAGCGMGCIFCATGTLRLRRNLSPGDIVAQVVWAAREMRRFAAERHLSPSAAPPDDDSWWTPDNLEDHSDVRSISVSRLSNIVFMGMGEPFANYDRWWRAVEIIHDPRGLNIGARSMTVSTVGLVPGIRRLATEKLPINLAISLHAPDDDLRSALLPINRRYPLAALFEATRDYLTATGRRVSFEYVLLQGKNDEPEHAAKLAALLRGEAGTVQLPLHLVHVNLIPWNPVPGMPLGRSERQRVLTFQRVLRERGIACTVRVERGVSIAAACGQLAGTREP